MVKLEYMESGGVRDRHQAWTRIGAEPYQLSPLQNQFALSEFALPEQEAVQQFRAWLWQQLQDRFNVVSRAMRELAIAHRQGQEVEVVVPKEALHGAVIVRAILWAAENLEPVELPAIRGSAPGSCYEPIVPDGMVTTRVEIDPRHIVWVTGRTQSRIGVICGWGEAFVPEYGVIPLKNFRWVNRRLATSPGLQALLNDELDRAFEAEADATPLEYDPAPPYGPDERFDESEWFWQQSPEETTAIEGALAAAERDTLTLVEQLMEETGDVETAITVAQMPEVEDWYLKRPPLPGNTQPEMMRPVYKYTGENSPLMIRSVEDQVEDRRFRYATKTETEEYIRTFRS
jgi:hypothetical protein